MSQLLFKFRRRAAVHSRSRFYLVFQGSVKILCPSDHPWRASFFVETNDITNRYMDSQLTHGPTDSKVKKPCAQREVLNCGFQLFQCPESRLQDLGFGVGAVQLLLRSWPPSFWNQAVALTGELLALVKGTGLWFKSCNLQ